MFWRGLYNNQYDIPLDVLTSDLDTPEVINTWPIFEDTGGYAYKTPLKAACMTCRLDFAQWLLEHGADPNKHPPESMLPLECALDPRPIGTMKERDQLIIMLLEAGAKLERIEYIPQWIRDYHSERQHRRAARRALGAILCARGVPRDVRLALM